MRTLVKQQQALAIIECLEESLARIVLMESNEATKKAIYLHCAMILHYKQWHQFFLSPVADRIFETDFAASVEGEGSDAIDWKHQIADLCAWTENLSNHSSSFNREQNTAGQSLEIKSEITLGLATAALLGLEITKYFAPSLVVFSSAALLPSLILGAMFLLVFAFLITSVVFYFQGRAIRDEVNPFEHINEVKTKDISDYAAKKSSQQNFQELDISFLEDSVRPSLRELPQEISYAMTHHLFFNLPKEQLSEQLQSAAAVMYPQLK